MKSTKPSEKIKNETRAKEEFDRRVKETKRKAIEENIKLAEKSGNKLTQTITQVSFISAIFSSAVKDSKKVTHGSIVDLGKST